MSALVHLVGHNSLPLLFPGKCVENCQQEQFSLRQWTCSRKTRSAFQCILSEHAIREKNGRSMRYILLFFWQCSVDTWQAKPYFSSYQSCLGFLPHYIWWPSNFTKKVNTFFFEYYGFPQLKFLEDKEESFYMKYANWNVILHLNLIFDIFHERGCARILTYAGRGLR